MQTPIIRIETPDQPDVRDMLAEGDAYYATLYPAESNHLVDISTLQGPQTSFYVARVDGRLRGIGAILRQQSYGEIKRMYVDPKARGLKLGSRLLAALEADARAVGITCLRLETGVRQPEAIALYVKSGYREIAPFGAYQLDPHSLYMEKTLDA
ncbi:GNAT family N-acetyltransferase [Dongia rigui]|uniref:GNAT family N-acetyltransferase n=1 Tax=Dongia rigui TaxID=940149 RepID=A0ABU5E2A7_9PROT|nr:GNAT family N-acetyltransferase [Dongia rigui]MDY0873033.1 GNAT family N-acetyltransferase [Dongia rigui]